MGRKTFLFSLFLILVYGVCSQVNEARIKNGIKAFVENRTFTEDFRNYLHSLKMKHALRSDPPKDVRADEICILCNAILEQVLIIFRIGLIPDGLLQELIIEFCIDLHFESADVCSGAVSTYAPTAFHLLHSRPTLHAETFCGIYLQTYGCDGYFNEWSVAIPPGNTPNVPKGEISDLPPLNVLQVTDIHYDPLYEPGSDAVCGDPLCCQVNSSSEANPENAAGFWGDYRNCDAPFHAITEALDYISQNHLEIDYFYYTGDIIQHLVWGTSIATNIRDNELIYRTLKDAFPNIPIYPILGNHEPHPCNLFSPAHLENEPISTQWLFNQVAEIWGDWLGDETRETIRKGGYYTVLVKPGFRIIALNSNVGYTGNFWLLYDYVDPFEQLQWLADTLLEAESNGEIVHILSHVPSSSSSTFWIWSREYRRILERFSNTIVAAFNGHTHDDQFIVYHNSSNPGEAINVAWNGGSLTPFSHNNPNYKIYRVDAESYEVLDFDVWIYNLTAANLTPSQRPQWYKLYTFKDAYGLSGAAPSDLRGLAESMAENRFLIEQYARFFNRESDTSLASGCDVDCLRNHLCTLLRSETLDDTQCEEILANAVW